MEVTNWAQESGRLGEGKWKIGRREVENWPKGSGKLAEGKWQINTCSWTGGNKYEI